MAPRTAGYSHAGRLPALLHFERARNVRARRSPAGGTPPPTPQLLPPPPPAPQPQDFLDTDEEAIAARAFRADAARADAAATAATEATAEAAAAATEAAATMAALDTVETDDTEMMEDADSISVSLSASVPVHCISASPLSYAAASTIAKLTTARGQIEFHFVKKRVGVNMPATCVNIPSRWLLPTDVVMTISELKSKLVQAGEAALLAADMCLFDDSRPTFLNHEPVFHIKEPGTRRLTYITNAVGVAGTTEQLVNTFRDAAKATMHITVFLVRIQ